MPSDAIIEGVSGAIGGCVATVATYPLMTISARQVTRVRKSTQTTDIESQSQAPSSTIFRHHRGTLYELEQTIRRSGWKSLFSGLSASLVGTTVSQGVYFYFYSLLRQLAVYRRTQGRATPVRDARSVDVTIAESLTVAALAGMINVLMTNPIWMIATRMQTHSNHYKQTLLQQQQQQLEKEETGEDKEKQSSDNNSNTSSSNTTTNNTQTKHNQQSTTNPTLIKIKHATLGLPPPTPLAVARDVYTEYGVKGFWNGCGASLVMVINPTIQYAFYEWLMAARTRMKQQQRYNNSSRNNISNSSNNSRPSAVEVFLLSALAKAGATILTYPLLTVKTRMMSARKADAEMQYASVMDAILQIAKKEGFLGYYKGLHTKIVQSVLAAALLFVCKEKITDFTRDVLFAQSSEDGEKKG